jgi:hypothetical protein
MANTAMVDRLRPETHSFHLPCGEMTVTLEGVAMILGLSIIRCPITGRVNSAGWRKRVIVFIGQEPPMRVPGMKGREAGVHVLWLHEEFHECPPDPDEATVTTVLFLDSTGDATSWMYIPALAHWHEACSYSWGSAVLPYLYRQLCDACRRRGKTSGLRGCCDILAQGLI